ncbi:two-component sensor histidine kinase [Streptomyces pluripotens]|uniref:histidine kinase n=1 Tax=Streptomyces pluripotens TaxID=1355015 RepID=A0A221NS07_9ACTN|nr:MULTISPECIES: histidine kinase [Streptomyces]ASN22750.1 two-component sensor histidine kinase [Streptomyces pluripotens]KIE25449.1 transcriptional regulator [Streptomyces sp. MUSC 125]MCH0560635.1 two-component sensor histidine kinase [Streptomyces sp. MUM 16J]
MLRDDLQALWTEPRPPGAPDRVWRDWVLLAVGLGSVVLEGTLREDVVWRPVAVVFTVWLCVLPMWRRTRPLAVVALGFGAMMALQLASLVAAPPEPVGLYTGAVVLVLVYALPRWGSGQEVVLGGTVILTAFATSALTDHTPAVDQVVGLAFLLLPALIGASVRFRVTARERRLDRSRSLERERLARELHDTVAHHVSALVIRAQAGRVLAATDSGAAVEALVGVEEEGARTLEEMRAMVAALRDGGGGAELAPLAGVADLERLVDSPNGRLRVDLELGGDLDMLPPAVDAAVYRIVQESVTNAMRHALDATAIVIRVAGEPHTIRVTVRDDGARSGRGHDGYGLAGLRERAALLGGWLQAGPGADRGWSVEAELPRGRADSGAHPGSRR